MFSSVHSVVFVCLFVSGITQKTIVSRFSTKFGGKVAHGERKKPLVFLW